MTSEIADMLEGFEFVPSDGVPFITLDNQRRFYLNSSARRLLDVRPYDRVIVGYRPMDKKLAIIKTDKPLPDKDASLSDYFIDKRYYMSARKFASTYAYVPEEAPYEFVYDKASSDGDVFIFRLKW